jgi:hypothetical protein
MGIIILPMFCGFSSVSLNFCENSHARVVRLLQFFWFLYSREKTSMLTEIFSYGDFPKYAIYYIELPKEYHKLR